MAYVDLRAAYYVSQSPYGAKWFATDIEWKLTGNITVSQSPYGAKWFATRSFRYYERKGLEREVAIPLRG